MTQVRPAPAASSSPPAEVAERARRIVAEFAALGDWLDRYRYVVASGEGMAHLGNEQRTEANRLPGCQYGLWIACEYDAAAGILHFRADSDAKITRGLAALILRVLDGLPPGVVADADLTFLDTIGLRAHLSSQRGDGLDAMIHEIRRRARHYRDTGTELP